MSSSEVDGYLAGVDEPHRAALAQLRGQLAALLPDAEEGLSYAAPCFRLGGKLVAGFSAAAKHVSYLPHSGTVLTSLEPALLDGYRWSKGALTFDPAQPLPLALVLALVNARLSELGLPARSLPMA